MGTVARSALLFPLGSGIKHIAKESQSVFLVGWMFDPDGDSDAHDDVDAE